MAVAALRRLLKPVLLLVVECRSFECLCKTEGRLRVGLLSPGSGDDVEEGTGSGEALARDRMKPGIKVKALGGEADVGLIGLGGVSTLFLPACVT